MAELTDQQKRYIELDKKKAEIKAYYEELEKVTAEVFSQVGPDGYFQDDEGTVYKTVVPTGGWVRYKMVDIIRTRREGEKKGDLSMTEAREAGFVVEGK